MPPAGNGGFSGPVGISKLRWGKIFYTNGGKFICLKYNHIHIIIKKYLHFKQVFESSTENKW